MCYAAIAGLGIGVAGKMKQSEADAQALEYQASINKYNANVAGAEALAAERVGVSKVSDFRLKGQIFASSQVATAGASGVEVGSGSFLDVVSDTERGIEADVQKIKEDYFRTKSAHLRARDLFLLEADINTQRAEGVRRDRFLGAAAVGAQGASQIYGQYQQSSYYSQN